MRSQIWPDFCAHRVSIISDPSVTKIATCTQRDISSQTHCDRHLKSQPTHSNISPPSDRSRLLELDNPPQRLLRFADLAAEFVRPCQLQPRFRVIPPCAESREAGQQHVCSFSRSESVEFRGRWVFVRRCRGMSGYGSRRWHCFWKA